MEHMEAVVGYEIEQGVGVRCRSIIVGGTSLSEDGKTAWKDDVTSFVAAPYGFCSMYLASTERKECTH